MPKNSLYWPAIILCLICLVTTGLVALTYSITLEARTEQAEIAANANRKLLFPDAAEFAAIENADLTQFTGLVEAFRVQDAGGGIQGYLIMARYRGYGGYVPVLLAFSPEGRIVRLKVLTNEETPGLGKKVENALFLKQFVGRGTDKPFSVRPQDSGSYIIDAVSGATISSRAVTNAVNIAAGFIRKTVLEVK
jgi:Na+-translocating ferredoxin:NAD+ oxidoreductase subunit G